MGDYFDQKRFLVTFVYKNHKNISVCSSR